jgi:hypothetical protein
MHPFNNSNAAAGNQLMSAVVQGVDMEQRNEIQDTALTYAALSGAFECMRMLIGRGADTSARDKYDNTVLLSLLHNGYGVSMVKHLLATGTLNMPSRLAALTEHISNFEQRVACSRWLGISTVTERNNDGDTPFLAAVQSWPVECAKLFLAYGASLHETDNLDTNALMNASLGHSTEVLHRTPMWRNCPALIRVVWASRWCNG